MKKMMIRIMMSAKTITGVMRTNPMCCIKGV